MAAKSRTMAQQKTKEAYCFIVPAFIYMILVLGYPIVYNIILSLKDVNVKNLKSGTSVFVGLQNYIDLFHDPTFLLVLRNTFIFTIACLFSSLPSDLHLRCFSIRNLNSQVRSEV